MGGRRSMSRGVATTVVLLLALALGMSLSGCSRDTSSSLELTGRVINDTVALPAPILPSSTPNLEAGFEGTSTAAGTSLGASASSGATRANQTVWVRVAAVAVRPGQIVVAGDLIAVVETAALDAALITAKAQEKLATANLAVVDDTIGTVTTSASDVASKTAELTKTINDLTLQRADLQVKLSIAEGAAASLPPTITIPAGQSDPRVLKKELALAIAKIDAGLEKAKTGLEALTTAQTDIATVQSALTYARDASAAVAEAYGVATRIAQAQVDLSRVVAPFDAVIVDAAGVGEVLAGGAPIAVLRPSSAMKIETYVTAEERAMLTVGVQTGVLADSQPSRGFTGSVSAIGQEYGYVPTFFATKIIHLTRGFRVEIELDRGQMLPAGTPVDVSISVK